jgi:hypothetical protein
MKTFLLFFAGGVILVAGLVELYKLGNEKKQSKIITLSVFLTLIMVCSVFFGVEHEGNIYTLPLWALGMWYLQKVVDMKFFRKIAKRIASNVAKSKSLLTDDDIKEMDNE